MTSRRDHGDGGIDQRGPDQWRLRWRVGGKRYSKAFHGTKRAAQAELRRIISEADIGAAVAPVKLTVRQHLRRWLDGQYGLSAKTRERYEQLVGNQINPQLGDVLIQALRPAQIKMWHGKLIESGLSTITVGMPTGRCIVPSSTPLKSSWSNETLPAWSGPQSPSTHRSKSLALTRSPTL